MPRSAGAKRKAKNAGVGIDFKRAKHKVGKKLPKAQNETNTDFKSKAIALPSQNVGEDKGVAVTSKNQTLKELLAHSGHYSGKVRQEALTGIGELLEAHPDELFRQASHIVEKLVDRFSDQEGSVRKALHTLLINHILRKLGPERLVPFTPLIMAHISGSMTHLQEDIRRDAMNLLDALVSIVPDQISGQYLAPAMKHYTSLLSQSGRAQTLAAGTQSHLLQVLTSLSRFLANIRLNGGAELTINSNQEGINLLQSSKEKPRTSAPLEEENLQQPLFWKRWNPPNQLNVDAAKDALRQVSGQKGHVSFTQNSRHAQEELREELMKTWEESAMISNSPDSGIITIQCMEASVNCLVQILADYGAFGWHYRDTVKKFIPYFPMSSPSTIKGTTMTNAILKFNTAGLKLFHLFLDVCSNEVGDVPDWLWKLFQYHHDILQHGVILPLEKEVDADTKQPEIPVEVYQIILSGTCMLIDRIEEHREETNELMCAITEFFGKSKAGSGPQLACLEFLQEVTSKPRQYLAKFTRIEREVSPLIKEEFVVSWLKVLPRTLWKLSSMEDSSPCHILLEILSNIAKYLGDNEAISASLLQIQGELCPFYGTEISCPKYESVSERRIRCRQPARMSMGGKCSDPLPKAFSTRIPYLPAKTQALAINLLYYFKTLKPVLLKRLEWICVRPEFTNEIASEVFNLLAVRAKDKNSTGDLISTSLKFLQANEYFGLFKEPGFELDEEWELKACEISEQLHSALAYNDHGQILKILAEKDDLLQKYKSQVHYRLILATILRFSRTIKPVDQDTKCQGASESRYPEKNLEGIEACDHENNQDKDASNEKGSLPSKLDCRLPKALCRLIIGIRFKKLPVRQEVEYQSSLNLIGQYLIAHPCLIVNFFGKLAGKRKNLSTQKETQTDQNKSMQSKSETEIESENESETESDYSELDKDEDEEDGAKEGMKEESVASPYKRPGLLKRAELIMHLLNNQETRAGLSGHIQVVQAAAKRIWENSRQDKCPQTQQTCQQMKTTVETLLGSWDQV